MSHTVTCEIDIRDREAFAAVARAMGAEILGEGVHSLFESHEAGLGIKLDGWLFPIVLGEKGLKFDDYGGKWGNPADIGALTERYALSVARKAAEAQGWYCEEAAGTLTIYHPDGGTITVGADGSVDAACFEGRSCADATAPLEAALGRARESVSKPEMLHERARVSVQS